MTDSETPAMPEAWAELIEAITLLATHPSSIISPFHCEHDTLTVMADPADFTEDELARLETIGFFPGGDADGDAATFYSFRYGSA